MSVASKNPFALLDDDVSQEVTTAAASAAPQQSADGALPAPQARSNKEQKSRSGSASRGGGYYRRGNLKNVVKDTPEQDQEPTPRESRRDAEYRGRGRGGRDGRNGRGGRGRGGGREFDRHSGTLPDSEKKVNQGWGANEGNAELNAEEQAAADIVVDNNGWGVTLTAEDAPAGDGWGGVTDEVKVDVTTNNAANGTATESRRAYHNQDEEDNTVTYEEYIAKKANLSVPKLESMRKANEGSDESIWKDIVPLSKEEDDNYFVGKIKAPPKARAKKEEKVMIEIDAHFERPSRPAGRGRGGQPGERARAGGRGRGRGGSRGGVNRSGGDDDDTLQAVNVEDQAAFPSLS